MKYSDLVNKKVARIKEYVGLELEVLSTGFKKKGGLITFNVAMNTNFMNRDFQKLHELMRVGIIQKHEPNGHNVVLIHFAQ